MSALPGPPVVPRPELLPLNDPAFTWQRFQAFCRDLIAALPEFTSCDEYGVGGDNQDGIDLVAPREDATEWVFQCKKVGKFTRVDTQEAIAKATFPADHYVLLLSRAATESVQDTVRQHNWDVWDVRRLSDLVRNLPTDLARRIVEAHFGPVWRQLFLGLRGLTAFQTPEDFFADLSQPDRLFNHAWSLVGRADTLNGLSDFLRSEQRIVAVVPGRGGIGKSRLLKELALSATLTRDWSVVLAAEGIPLTTEALDELPAAPCLIVVDDAHRRENLEILLALVRRRQHPTKLLLATRPSGLDRLRSSFARAGIDISSIEQILELQELASSEVREIAKQALGPSHEQYSDLLVAASRDCPLVTVIGGRLLAQEAIHPHLLERHQEFREAVLIRFQEEMLGCISPAIDQSLCKKLLRLIAAVGPVNPERSDFHQAAAEFLGIEVPDLVECLGVLETTGLFLRRKESVRVTPDVLADHLLYEASINQAGQRTGYVEQVYERFSALCPESLLQNLGELDWRIRSTGGHTPDLLEEVWGEVRQEFADASNSGRCHILGLLKGFASYQPARILGLVEYAISHPSASPEPDLLARHMLFDHGQVLRELPPLLARIARLPEYCSRCCDLLWQLGRDDDRPVGHSQLHAFQALKELAEYGPWNTIATQTAVLAAVARWLDEADADQHCHSLLDIVDPMLEKSGTYETSIGISVTIRDFYVDPSKCQALRVRALEIVGRCAKSSTIKVVLRAIDSFRAALSEPKVYFRSELTDEQISAWVPEQLMVLSLLREAVHRSSSPLIHLRVLEFVRPHASQSSHENVRRECGELIREIPDVPDLRLFRELAYGSDPGWVPKPDDDRLLAYEQYRIERRETERAVAREVLEICQTPADAIALIETSLKEINDAGMAPKPVGLLLALAETGPAFALEMCHALAQRPSSLLASYVGPLLVPVRRHDVQGATSLAQSIVEHGDAQQCLSIAELMEWPEWGPRLLRENAQLFERLLAHDVTEVRVATLQSLRRAGPSDPQAATRLALAVDVGESWELASAACSIFTPDWGMGIHALEDRDVEALLGKLLAVPSIDDHSITDCLAALAGQYPEQVIQLLINRIQIEERDGHGRYDGRPPKVFAEVELLRKQPARHAQLLRSIRDRIPGSAWPASSQLAELFVGLAALHNQVGSAVLEEWTVDSNSAQVEAVATIVAEAQPEFVFQQVDLVAQMLEQASSIGGECLDQVRDSLRRCAIAQTGWSTPIEPAPYLVKLQDSAATVTERLPDDCVAQRFYKDLVAWAETRIQEDLKRDQDLLD